MNNQLWDNVRSSRENPSPSSHHPHLNSALRGFNQAKNTMIHHWPVTTSKGVRHESQWTAASNEGDSQLANEENQLGHNGEEEGGDVEQRNRIVEFSSQSLKWTDAKDQSNKKSCSSTATRRRLVKEFSDNPHRQSAGVVAAIAHGHRVDRHPMYQTTNDTEEEQTAVNAIDEQIQEQQQFVVDEDHLYLDHLAVEEVNDAHQFSYSSGDSSTHQEVCGGGIISYNSYKQKQNSRQTNNSQSELHETFGHQLAGQRRGCQEDDSQRVVNVSAEILHSNDGYIYQESDQTKKVVFSGEVKHSQSSSPCRSSGEKDKERGCQKILVECQSCYGSMLEKDVEISRLNEEVLILEEQLSATQTGFLNLQAVKYQRSRPISPSGQSVDVVGELYKQTDKLNEVIDELREENRQLKEDVQKLIQSSSDTKYLLQSEINVLAQENHKLRGKSTGGPMMNVQIQTMKKQIKLVQNENVELVEEVRGLEERTKKLLEQNRQLVAVNEAQQEDIAHMLQGKDALYSELQATIKRKEIHAAQETTRICEQIKFSLTKDFEEKLNNKVQEIHYKTHNQIDKYKQLLRNTEINELGTHGQERKTSRERGDQHTVKVSNVTSQGTLHGIPYSINMYGGTQGILSPQQLSATGRMIQFTGREKNGSRERDVQQSTSRGDKMSGSPPPQQKGQGSLHLRSEENENCGGNRTRRSTCHSNGKSRCNTVVTSTSTMTNLVNGVEKTDQNYIERRVAWEICGILRCESVESLPGVIGRLKDQQKTLQKFADCIIEMVISCHPHGFFDEEGDTFHTGRMRSQEQQCLPSLKQSWKWLKQIMEEYMQLKSQPPCDDFENQVCSLLNVPNKLVALRAISDKAVETTIANRIFKKVTEIMKIPQCKTYTELEVAVQRIHYQNNQPQQVSSRNKLGSAIQNTSSHKQQLPVY